MQQVATDVFGNALGQSIAAVASQVSTTGSSVQEDRLGAFIQENLGAWTQRQANYDQLVDSFGNYTADSRADGVQLAAGADYTGGIGSGLSDRDADIARMLKLANDPQAMGSLRGPDGIYRLEITGIGSTGAGDGTRWIPDTDSLGGTVAGKRMTQAEMDEFDRLNAAEMIDAKAARYGSITAYQPSVWERTWLSRDVQNALGSSFTGMVAGSVVNAAGSISASIRSDRYNFATDKYLNPVEQRNARIDNLINLAALPFGGGIAGSTRQELQGSVRFLGRSTESGSLAARMERIASRTPEESADRARIAALINKARAQCDPGVPQLIGKLERYGINIKDTNHYIGNPSREVDIETSAGIILQVKKLSSAQKIILQIQDTERATGKQR